MDPLPQPDEVLAQPTRARLFAALAELKRPTSTEELAELLGLHRNGVRLHLERLAGAGLLVRERARHGPGRPRDMWAIATDAQPGGDPPSAYANLGRWLARTIQPRKTTTLRTVEASGREIGRELAPTGEGVGPEEKMYTALISLGFQPRREVDSAGGLTYRLCNCPYRDVVRENRVVCTLHRGITRGLLDRLSPGTKLTGFVARDPDTAGCRIELQGELADTAIEATADAPE
jgi:predicted ArsR family transcriptional regulator